MPKSQKKYPAPAAPEPQPTSSSGEAVSEKPLKSVEKEEHKSEKEELNGLSEEKLEMPKEVIPSKTK
ncbi:50S ribosomal protein L12P domain protein, partial [Cooperia oncophora]